MKVTSPSRAAAISSAKEGVLRLELPLLTNEGGSVYHFGILELVKNIENQPAGHFMLSRIEHLRRSIVIALEQMADHLPRDEAPGTN